MNSSVTNVHLPDGMSYADLHNALKGEGFAGYGVPEQRGTVFRVVTMGQLSVPDVENFLAALDRIVRKLREQEELG
jgi:2-aminoethylphosphonate-pyruvate transaminase